MIWNDEALELWVTFGGVTPFDPACINPASIDLRWSGRWRMATESGFADMKESSALTIEPGRLFLLDTLEYVTMPKNACGMLMLKSSIGRMGLEHLHAGWFDPGFHGTATLEIVNVAPWSVTLKRGQRIVQLAMVGMISPPRLHYGQTGRYNGQAEPQPAKEW